MVSTNSSTQRPRGAAEAGLDPASVLGFIYEGRRFITPDNAALVYGAYQVPASGPPGAFLRLEEIGVDMGNSSTKTVVMHLDLNTLAFTETPTTYEVIPSLLFGENAETWRERFFDDDTKAMFVAQVNSGQRAEMPSQYSETFMIGAHAQSRKSLAIGGTDARLSDPRHSRYAKACLVQGLRAAGYPPGTYYLGAAFGVRNDEMVNLAVQDSVQAAINNTLARSFTLIRNGEKGEEEWHIDIVETIPLPQSFGTYYALNTGIYGQVIHPQVRRWTIFDLGYNDGHVLEVNRSENSLQVTGQKVASGAVDIARGLVVELRKPGHFSFLPSDLSDTEAIEILHSEQLLIAGMPLRQQGEARRATDLIRAYKDREGVSLIRSMAARHTRLDSTFVFGGGGNTEFTHQIQTLMKTLERPDHLNIIIPPQVARVANVAGLYWMLNVRKRRYSVSR